MFSNFDRTCPRQVRGLILQSPVLSMYRVAMHLRFTLPGDLFPNIDKITGVQCPTSARDEREHVSHLPFCLFGMFAGWRR